MQKYYFGTNLVPFKKYSKNAVNKNVKIKTLNLFTQHYMGCKLFIESTKQPPT